MADNRVFQFVRQNGILKLKQEAVPGVPESLFPVTHTIDLLELKSEGKTVGLKAPSLSTSYQLCLPIDGGTTGQILTTDGEQLSWSNTSSAGSTGVLVGGLITINADPTKFDVSDGNGTIFDTTTMTATKVSWSGLTAQSTVYVGDETFISLDSTGSVVYSASLPTNSGVRDNIYLGQIVHLDQINILATLGEQMTLLSSTNQIRDFMQAVGQLKVSGNLCNSNSLLTVAKSAGELLKFGGNYGVDKDNPHLPTSGALDTNAGGTFSYRWQDSTQRTTLVDIEPNEYDDGNGESAPGSVGTNKWTVQRLFTFSIGALVIQQGQFVYNTKEEAIAAIDSEGFVVEPDLAISGVLICYLALRGNAIDLSDPSDAQFIEVAKFGGSSAGTAAGVSGPISSTDTAVARWDGTNGMLLQDSVVTIGSAGVLSTPKSVVVNATDSQNTKYGFQALDSVTSGTHNTAIGDDSLTGITTGSQNTGVGSQALRIHDGVRNTAVGYNALPVVTGIDNVALGANAGLISVTGVGNVFVGTNACNNGTPSNCVAVGREAMQSHSGSSNIAIGSDALDATGTGGSNIAVGSNALGQTTGVAEKNVGIGVSSISTATSSSNSVAVGHQTLSNLGGGDGNVAIGYQAGMNLTLTDNDNICIGNLGVAGDSGEIRIGTSHVKNFQAGIRGVTTDVADALAVLVDSSGQLGTVSSSLRYKRDVETMGRVESSINAMRPVNFRYKSDRQEYGLIAEEVNGVIPDLVVLKDGIPDSIQYHKLFAFLIKGLQECYERIEDLEL